YREATQPVQRELTIPGLEEELKKTVNRPVPELPISDETSVINIRPFTPVSNGGNGHGSARALTSTFVNQGDAPTCPSCGHVVVRHGEIVGRGCNQVTSTNDPTAHAEIVAIREACKNLNTFKLDDCEIYTSCEPCPMCLAAIYWSRLKKAYYGNTRKDAAAIG